MVSNSKFHHIFSFLFAVVLVVLSKLAWPAAAGRPTAYEVLQQNGLPAGLLPEGVVGYELDRATGKFSAFFNGSCGSYRLKYGSTITGRIAKGRVAGLQGVRVKVLFFWLNVGKVVRRGDRLQFSVGLASAATQAEHFEERPRCGGGSPGPLPGGLPYFLLRTIY